MKYPENVHAIMKRKNIEGVTRLFRTETKIWFGEASGPERLLGTVFMTNPGSYKMMHHPNWFEFHQGLGSVEEIRGESGPDSTMRNLIRVIREAYQDTELPLQSGYVAIYNISTLVEPKGTNIARLHDKTKAVLGKEGAVLLREQACYDLDLFREKCEKSSFIILGFLKDVFPEEQRRIIDWCRSFDRKMAYAESKQGHYIHPYQWPLIPGALDQVKLRLRNAVQSGGSDRVPT